ncbi:DUF6709 family protein [Allofournierella sp.]|uniref:DUF6709 family protein n=1 Tax=Allofournierella sp. TaxID=1940256 RepID=UPI003AB2AD96
MLQELKKQSLKRVLPAVILLAVFAAVCLALGGAGMVDLVRGPDWLYDYYGEDLEGRYVEADVYVVYDWYAETTSRREGSSVETTKSRDFIIDANDMEYIALEVPAADLKRVEQQMYDSWDYLDDVTDDLTTYYHIEGTVERMDAETLGLYTEFLADGGTLDDAFLPYIIRQGKVHGMDKAFSVSMCVIGLALLVWLAVLLIKALTGGYQKSIKRRALAQGDLPLLEEFYIAAEPLHGVRSDGRWVLFNQGPKTILLDAPNVLWAYVHRLTHRTNGIKTGTTWSVQLRTGDRKVYTLGAKNEEQARELLQMLAASMPHLVTGYSDALNRLFSQDPARFATIPTDTALQQELFG